ncbi:hypothetical protein MVI01_51680 [Myxococcus virescens]|uniref:Uncharacterized protein n=1 Tax=Myxococcus virescens TaxID=83456 RepID=A0A511HJ20_9BACT|nr:hypothetical protein MVI01_51680 [Myxococcus virescens]
MPCTGAGLTLRDPLIERVGAPRPPLPSPVLPQGNRIKRVWLELHANVTRNHRCRPLATLMSRVHAYLSARNA